MAVMMLMEWDGIGEKEYEAARKQVNWEGDVPPGAMFHVMAVTDQGVRVTDVWESAEDFEAFARDRLMPGVKELGIPGEPRVQLLPVHAIFAPAYSRG
jgi:hypothetical protein